jgi:hypothetical protein
MSNCDFVAGGSLIDLVTSRLALRAPALARFPHRIDADEVPLRTAARRF